MTGQRELAHSIIDLVEEAIRKAHPEIEPFVPKEDEDKNPINTFLHGESYYDLEDAIVELLPKSDLQIFATFDMGFQEFERLVREQAEKGLEIESENDTVEDVEEFLKQAREDMRTGVTSHVVIDTDETNIWLEEFVQPESSENRMWLVSIYPRDERLTSVKNLRGE